MSPAGTTWDPHEWQTLVETLARLRHGAGNFQKVPDKHGGDCGIECFSKDGFAYQAYCPKEPLSTKDRHEKQRLKLNEDIEKFSVKNVKKLEEIFGAAVIKYWILAVPIHESSSLIGHANAKASHVRSLGLKYVDKDFSISIETADDFPKERAMIAQFGLNKINVATTDPDPVALGTWISANDKLSQTLDSKLEALPRYRDAGRRAAGRDTFIKHYLQSQNILSGLKATYPELYEAAERIIREREKFLEMELAAADGTANQVLGKQVNLLKGDLTKHLIALPESSVAALSWGAVSDWLLRCPLDFDGVE